MTQKGQKEMKDLHVNVLSSEMDLKLFTDRKYYKKVYKALKKAKERYVITEKYMIACYENFIKVYTPKKELMMIQEF